MRISDWRSDGCSADLTARVYGTQASTDVTDRIVDGLGGMDGKARYDAIDARSKALVAECEAPGGLRCNVYNFNGGLEFSLIRQLEIQDVRLVYPPPASIGQYGGVEARKSVGEGKSVADTFDLGGLRSLK